MSSTVASESQAGHCSGLRAQVAHIIEAFSQSDVQHALDCFREDARYETLSGTVCHGLRAIERELTPQFRGDYGVMRFHLARVIVDESKREAAIAWTCEHVLDQGQPETRAGRLLQRALRTAFGPRASWDGVDLLRFDEAGLIIDKRTFAKARVLAIHRA